MEILISSIRDKAIAKAEQDPIIEPKCIVAIPFTAITPSNLHVSL
jgi:hypothetical protein